MPRNPYNLSPNTLKGRIPAVTGDVVFVDSVNGASNGDGSSLRPFSSVQNAFAKSGLSTGDAIVCLMSHAETISSATSLSLSVAGIRIIGMNEGALRPTFTFTTAATATINVTAANITIENCLFVANFADVVSAFTTTTAKNFSIKNCEFRDTSSALNFNYLVDTNTTTNDTDGLSITDSYWFGLTATANSGCIKMDGTNNRLFFRRNYITHAATTAAGFMQIATGKVVTNMICDSNVFNLVGATNLTTGTLITTDGSTNSGVIMKNTVHELDATSEILVTASSGFIFDQNSSSAVADKSGYTLPAADA